MEEKRKNLAGHLMALITILFWGTTFISTKVLLREFTPIEILFYRFSIGFVMLWIFFPHRLKVQDIRQELIFIGAGLCGVTLYFLFENIALTMSFASNVGMIVSISPFFTALFAHFFLAEERLRPQFFFGFLAAISGIAIISFHGSSVLKLNPLGDFLAVLSAAVWAMYSILTRKISAFGYHTIQSTRRIFFYGLIFMIPALFLFRFRLGIDRLHTPVNLFNILYLGLGASAVCFVTWNSALRILGAVKTSVYIYMVPVVTVVTSMLILKEEITASSVVGMALILFGLFISEHTWKKKANAADGSMRTAAEESLE